MDKRMSDDTVRRLLGPAEPELLCDQCFDRLDEYVELELRGRPADGEIPGMGLTSTAARPATRSTAAPRAREVPGRRARAPARVSDGIRRRERLDTGSPAPGTRVTDSSRR